jgi:hypothetical protein
MAASEVQPDILENSNAIQAESCREYVCLLCVLDSAERS